jgi:addiction module HigA family antidote
MNTFINKYKGIHPGLVLENELAKRGISKGPFALSIQEYPQTISAITKGKRNITSSLALRIERALSLEEGTFFLLQAYYDLKKEQEKQNIKPDISKFRTALFWDTDIHSINWMQQKKSVIERVFSRGNKKEKDEVLSFYGADVVKKILSETEVAL